MSTTTKDHTLQSDITKMKTEKDGSFKRADAAFRNQIEKGGEFEPELDRYHLFISYACPWATRTMIVRKLKGLEHIIPVTVLSPRMGENGWAFSGGDSYPGAEPDPLYGYDFIKEYYIKANPDYGGRFTVPVLWDKKNHTIVNNESAEVLRIFNTAFNGMIPAEKAAVDFYPEHLRSEIDKLNAWIYPGLNNGVYRAGFASGQEAYQKAVVEVFEALDKVEGLLANGKDYLIGNQLTEADIRLWVTMVRFDPVYYAHFKCNLRNIRDGYPNIHLWMRKLYWKNEAFQAVTDFDHIKTHYYWSQAFINPTRVVPVGPIPGIQPLL